MLVIAAIPSPAIFCDLLVDKGSETELQVSLCRNKHLEQDGVYDSHNRCTYSKKNGSAHIFVCMSRENK